MTAIRKIATGVEGLDPLLRGGIPEGRTTLVAGRSGSGKTVLALQIAAHLARTGHPVIVVAAEEAPDDLCGNGDALGLDYTGLKKADRIRFADATRFDGATIVAGEYDLQGLRHRLEALAGQIGARALVLDSATALFNPRPPPGELRSHFVQLVAGLRSLGLTTLVLAESPHDSGDLTTLGVEDSVFDLTIVLRHLADGGRRRRSIEIDKYRRSDHSTGEHPCAITPTGLAVLPSEIADVPDDPGGGERLPSGISGLDEMTCGGWLRHSLIVVRGPAGSGKTLVSAVLARAAAGRGEGVVYYGFEETPALLLRGLREMGVDLAPAIDNGRVHMSCRYGESTSLDDLFVEVRLALNAHAPSLIVFDGISSIEQSSSRKTFRQFLVGVASLVRQHGSTAVLTETAGASGSEYLSTLADAILSIGYSPGGGAERELRLVKSRGSAHAPDTYRMSIESGGPVVAPASKMR